MKVLVLTIISLLVSVSLSAQATSVYSLLQKVGDQDTLIYAKNEETYFRIGRVFQEESIHAFYIYPLGDNNFRVEIYSKQPDNSWKLFTSWKLEYGILIDVKFEDLNFDGLNDIVIQTVSGEQFDILFLTEQGQWYQSDYFNLGYKSLGAGYYYTYRSAGCGDGALRSDLLSFLGKAVKEHAELYVENCGDTPYQVDLRRINEDSKAELTSEFSAEIEIKRDNLKDFWMFYIKKYLPPQ